jgi:hypothetical protein
MGGVEVMMAAICCLHRAGFGVKIVISIVKENIKKTHLLELETRRSRALVPLQPYKCWCCYQSFDASTPTHFLSIWPCRLSLVVDTSKRVDVLAVNLMMVVAMV